MSQSARRFGFATLGVLVSGVLLSGCGGGTDESDSARSTIVVDGSSTVYRISSVAQEEYRALKPDVLVVVDNHGTGGGFGRYLQGEVDIVDASRAAKPEEEAQAKAQGIAWTRFVVGYDGITLAVNPKNTFASSLTVEQLKAIWEPDSKIKTWKDIDPSWPDRPIILYSPDNDSGTFEFFTEAIVGKARSQRDDVQTNADDNTLVNGIAGDPDALGYFGYAYYAANADKLKALAVQNGPDAKPVLPGADSIEDKSYSPLSRPLFIYVKNSSARKPEVAAFLKFYLDNIGKLATTARYNPPTDSDIAENQALLAKLPSPAKDSAAPAKATDAAEAAKPAESPAS
jgi:phosphate transport system substrate-binding protein